MFGWFFFSQLIFKFQRVTQIKIGECALANPNFKKNRFTGILERLLGSENVHGQTQPVVPSRFSASSFHRVCSKSTCSSSCFPAETCATGCGGGFGDPSPQGGSQAGSCSHCKQVLLHPSDHAGLTKHPPRHVGAVQVTEGGFTLVISYCKSRIEASRATL